MKILLVGIFAALVVEMVTSCASAKIASFEDDKMIYSTRKLETKDFYVTNFFVMDSITPVFSGFDLEIFMTMKQKISDGSAKAKVAEADNFLKEFVKKGEIIDFGSAGEEFKEICLISDVIYDKKDKKYLEYCFILTVYEDVYSKYVNLKNELESYIDLCEQNSNTCTKNMNACDSNIRACNETINACSNPTIQKSRVVSVPYTVTEQYWVAGTTGRRTNSSFGSSEGNPGHYETRSYTAYRNETEYYTVSNPNYSPSAVNKAKNDIRYWQDEKLKWNNDKNIWDNKKIETYKRLANLPPPFILEPLQPSKTE